MLCVLWTTHFPTSRNPSIIHHAKVAQLPLLIARLIRHVLLDGMFSNSFSNYSGFLCSLIAKKPTLFLTTCSDLFAYFEIFFYFFSCSFKLNTNFNYNFLLLKFESKILKELLRNNTSPFFQTMDWISLHSFKRNEHPSFSARASTNKQLSSQN